MVDAGSSYGSLIAGFALTGLGAGLFYPSVTTAGVTALDPSRTSLAGGLVYMCQIAGGAIGVAITTTIFTITSENDLDSKATTALHGHQLTDHQVAVLHGQLAGTDAAKHALQSASPVRSERGRADHQGLVRRRRAGGLPVRAPSPRSWAS